MILNSLFPDTSYSNESGGDPDEIPSLTYEDFLDFHRKYYHPSNSYLYLYGDMDMEAKLTWLDEHYLSGLTMLGLTLRSRCKSHLNIRWNGSGITPSPIRRQRR